MRAFVSTVAAASAWLFAGGAGAQSTLVSTTSGPVQGLDTGNVLEWRGVPYAEAPVGDLRYSRPVRKATSTTTLDATVNGPVCLQQIGPIGGCGSGQQGDVIGSEDCLSLYIWRPENPVSTPMPVMVFIHGGGGVQGCASAPSTNGADLALSQDLVVVSIQYRLGALGFFGLPVLAAEDPDGSTGNYAHLDQLEALAWIRDNIAAFDGDPDNVTIFGESAGGVAVCVLLASPLSDGLFDRAIIQSGGCQLALPLETTPGSPYDGATIFARSAQVAAGVSCGEGTDQLTCLRSPTTTGASLVLSLANLPGSFAGLAPANTALDGYVLSEQPVAQLREGAADGRAAIVGSNKDEMTLFTYGLESTMTSEAIYEQTVRDQIGDTAADLILPLYPVIPPTSPADTYRELTEDGGWACPTLGVADALAQSGSPAYVYHLNFAPTYGPFSLAPFLQTFHGLDLFYVFGTYPSLGFPPLAMELDADDAALSDSMQAAWASFARTGVPTTQPPWPVYAPTTPGDLASVSVLHFDAPNTALDGTLFRGGNCVDLAPIGALLDPDHDNANYDVDNCPTITNTSQADDDQDGVGQSCDTCVDRANPPFGGPTTNRALVSGQLDDDTDGWGNPCDFDYDNLGNLIAAGDTALFRMALGPPARNVNENSCGPLGGLACGIHDHDGLGNLISAADTAAFRTGLGPPSQNKNLAPLRKCAACAPPWSRAPGSTPGATLGRPICQDATGSSAPPRCAFAN